MGSIKRFLSDWWVAMGWAVGLSCVLIRASVWDSQHDNLRMERRDCEIAIMRDAGIETRPGASAEDVHMAFMDWVRTENQRPERPWTTTTRPVTP